MQFCFSCLIPVLESQAPVLGTSGPGHLSCDPASGGSLCSCSLCSSHYYPHGECLPTSYSFPWTPMEATKPATRCFVWISFRTDSKSSESAPSGTAHLGNGCHGIHSDAAFTVRTNESRRAIRGRMFFLPPPCA